LAEIAVILNARAGTIRDRQPGDVERIVREAFAGHSETISVDLVEGDQFIKAIDKASHRKVDTLIVGGGDGSVGYAARKLKGTDTVLGVLPLGTMNLLARSLGMPTDLEPALAALASADTKRIDLASVNGRIFHTLAGLGYFAEVARARAQVREDVSLPFSRYIAAARASFRAFTRPGVLNLTVETEAGKRDISTYALIVSNNRLSETGFDRARLDEGLLEAHFAEGEGLTPRFEAAIDILAGRWRENPAINTVDAPRITVLSHRSRLWLSVDGELVRAQTPLVFEVLPDALAVLVPKVDAA
jgi:YegS/Rv2252/BmrU family lipid kinase